MLRRLRRWPGDVEEGDTAEVGRCLAMSRRAILPRLRPVAHGHVEGGDSAEVEAVPGHVEEGDTVEVQAVPGHVEEGDTAEVDPAIADTAKVDPAIADTEKADTAPAGPYDDDTVETPAVLAGFSGRRHPLPQPPEQEVLHLRRFKILRAKNASDLWPLAAIALAALLIGAFFIASRDGAV